jgi:beta-glucosidase-like glycosyl hydrolase
VTDTTILGQPMPARAWGAEHLDELSRVEMILNAGCDQFGGEARPELVVQLVEQGRIAEERIDVSVRRLLREKFILGLFDDPSSSESPNRRVHFPSTCPDPWPPWKPAAPTFRSTRLSRSSGSVTASATRTAAVITDSGSDYSTSDASLAAAPSCTSTVRSSAPRRITSSITPPAAVSSARNRSSMPRTGWPAA